MKLLITALALGLAGASACQADIGDLPDHDISGVTPPTTTIQSSGRATTTTCNNLSSFENGCRVRVDRSGWLESYREFADAAGISDSGAMVQYFPADGAANHYENVVYIVGPQVMGKNFSTVSQERAWLGGFSVAPVMRQLDTYFSNRDVSVLYIGFGNAKDSEQPIAQRVEAVKTALKEFTKLRTSTKPATLFGVSLGGVVGKIALSEMEAAASPHNVGTYVSFDSPHWGAYIPLGLQYVPVFLAGAFGYADRKMDSGIISAFVIDTLDFFGALDQDSAQVPQQAAQGYVNLSLKSPVAQDTLIMNLGYEDAKSPGIQYLWNRAVRLPQRTQKNIAIASGSITGISPTLGSTFFNIDTGATSKSKGKLRMQMQSYIPTVEAPTTFWGRFRFRKPLYTSDHKYTRSRTLSERGITGLERGPCAHTNTLTQGLTSTVVPQFRKVWPAFSMNIVESKVCFIPSFSAVGGSWLSTTPAGSSPFDLVIGDSANKPHMGVSASMTTRLLAELDEVYGAPEEPMSSGLATPTGLRASVYSSSSVELFWDRPSTGGLRYRVTRNGSLVVDTDGVSFYESGLTRDTLYNYQVQAYDTDNNSSSPASVQVRTQN